MYIFLATRLFNQFSFFSRRKKERSKRSPKISHLVLISPLEKDSKFFFRILEDREEVLTGSLHTWKAWSGSPRTTLSNRVTRSSLSGSFVPESVFRSDEIVPSEFGLGSFTISLSSSWCPRNESQTFRYNRYARLDAPIRVLQTEWRDHKRSIVLRSILSKK